MSTATQTSPLLVGMAEAFPLLLPRSIAPPTYPPALVNARTRYAKAKAAYDRASATEDDTGEAIPRDIKIDLAHYERQLRREEQHAAHLANA